MFKNYDNGHYFGYVNNNMREGPGIFRDKEGMFYECEWKKD